MKLSYLYCLAILPFASSCSKDKTDNSFAWTQDGTIFYYDRYQHSDTTKEYLKLQVVDNRFFQNDAAIITNMHLLDDKFTVKKDGIYGFACETCQETGWIDCAKKITYLYAPAKAAKNQTLPMYSCGRNSYASLTIVNDDTIVNVPKGRYHTYVLLHDNGDKSYWNEASGIIMYEKKGNTDRGEEAEVYALARTE